MSTVMVSDRVRIQANELVQSGAHLRAQAVINGRVHDLPEEVGELLTRVLGDLASTQTVQMSSFPEELSPASSAEMLGVSRPTVMKWIRNGQLPARKVGTHHRVATSDVRALKLRLQETREDNFHGLRDLEEQLGINTDA